MTDLFSLVGIAVSAFVATNIDDIFVLMLFFSNPKFRTPQVVIGQYLGIGLLVAISALGSLLALVVPQYVIGLLGLVPISIGIIRLVHSLKSDKNSTPVHTTERASRWHHLSMLTVAAVTFSNGGDNIGIYTPLFAKYSLAYEVIFISVIFMIMTAIWCAIASYLVNHPLLHLESVRQDISYSLLFSLDLGYTFSQILFSFNRFSCLNSPKVKIQILLSQLTICTVMNIP